MARRKNAVEGAFILVVVIIAGIAWIIGKILGTVGVVIPVVVIVTLIVGTIWFKQNQKRDRIKALRLRYGSEEIVQLILQRRFWEGQTAQQLVDSIGSPLSIDRKSMATRKREVWKYHRTGTNRYGLRITLDDDVVTSWDQKN